MMKKKIIYALAACGLLFGSFTVNAADNNSAANPAKPISHVADVQNMADNTMVYIQGYLTQNLGDEMYVFQDDSGTMTVEIDDDLIGNMYSPDTMVWIAAEVDKNGNVTSLDAEEIQFMPADNNMANNNSSN